MTIALPRLRQKPSLITLADRARDAGDWEAAARLYRKALARNPRNPPIWVQYGHALKESGRLGEAEAAYRRALFFQPKAADSELQLGHVLKLQGRTDAAEAAYLRALALNPLLSDVPRELQALGWSHNYLTELAYSASRSARQQYKLRPERPVPTVTAASSPVVCAQALPPTSRQFSVLFISGAPDIPSHEYRVANYIDALAMHGIDSQWISASEATRHLYLLSKSSIAVFFRVGYTPELDQFIDQAKRLDVPTVFDIDDYVFEPSIATTEYIDGIRFVPQHELSAYYWGIDAYRQMLLRCSFATFTTKFLVDQGRKLGRQSFHLPNGLDRGYMSAEPRRWDSPRTRVVIGYASGTRTHQKDMRVAAAAIARVLAENPHAVLRIVGHFDIFEIDEWRPYHDQIEHDPSIVRRDILCEKIRNFDVNIAPLEIGNPFTEAKSELKYFEAASLGVPTVASATAVFREAIRDGETGFLASTEDEWYRALTALVRDFSLRKKIAAAARESAVGAYGLEAAGKTACRIYTEIISCHRRGIGRTPAALTITMLMPEPFRGSGGHSKALALMRGLADRGHDVAIHFTDSLGELQTPDAVRREFGLPSTVLINSGPQTFRPCDVAIATFWKTAYILYSMPRIAAVKAYFMQDYEPLFYPMGDDYILAQNSYQLGLRNISYGPWVRDKIKREVGADADWIPFFIDKTTFFSDANVPRSNSRLIVFGRPEMARRLWNLTLAAIDQFRQKSNYLGTIEFFGSHTFPPVPFPCIQHGVISSTEMAELFRGGTLGIAISSTNLSMVPFEMMACGLPVVDIDYNNNQLSYGGRENVFLAEPTVGALAATIDKAMSDGESRQSVSLKAREFIKQIADPRRGVDEFEALLSRYIDEIDRESSARG
jgi:glycosyltransferase involved in cell wall biosynthesis